MLPSVLGAYAARGALGSDRYKDHGGSMDAVERSLLLQRGLTPGPHGQS